MKARELRQKSVDELRSELTSLLRSQFSLRMKKSTDQQTPDHLFKQVRRDIARIKTLLREKELQGDAA